MDQIANILGLCRGIFWIAAEVKVNKKRCRRLTERVKAMEGLVEALKQQGPGHISANVQRALWKLSVTLTAAHELVKKCAKTKLVNLVKCNSEFSAVTEGLRDTYHVLAGALQVDQGNKMRWMFPDLDDDDDDDDGLLRALAPSASVMSPMLGSLASSSGAMSPFRYSPAAAPLPFFPTAAARPQTNAAVFTALMGDDQDVLIVSRAFFLSQ